MHGPGYPWLGLLGLGSGLVFWAGIVLLIIWIVRSLMASSAMHPAPVPAAAFRTPREILDERLAKGEITPDDYEKAKTALGGW
jgi:uncharacterized membrane protein